MVNVPDKWVICQIDLPDTEKFYKIFATWPGYWRLNSGIEKVSDDGDFYVTRGTSGSRYDLGKGCYGVVGLYNMGILTSLEDKFTNQFKVLTEKEALSWLEEKILLDKPDAGVYNIS